MSKGKSPLLELLEAYIDTMFWADEGTFDAGRAGLKWAQASRRRKKGKAIDHPMR